MAGIEVREEGDGIWVVTVPGIHGRDDLPDDFEERCYEVGVMLAGVDGALIHVTPRPDVEPPISDTLEKLRGYLASIAPGAAR
jgi:hypothetical protein